MCKHNRPTLFFKRVNFENKYSLTITFIENNQNDDMAQSTSSLRKCVCICNIVYFIKYILHIELS